MKISSSIGLRLKEERLRLGLSQSAFAAIPAASKRSMIAWEKGESSPNAVALAAFVDAGVDVLYLLTGQRSHTSTAQTLSSETVETSLAEIEKSSADLHGHAQKLREYAQCPGLDQRTRAKADRLLAFIGDEAAIRRNETRERRRDEDFEKAKRIVREARFVVEWDAPERLEAELIRLVVNYGVGAREIEELLRSARDAMAP